MSSIYRKILVTGGTGLLGSALRSISGDYPDREFVFSGSRDCDLTDMRHTLAYVSAQRPDAVLHLAAVCGGIELSMKRPATLLRDNVRMNLNVIEACRIAGVGKTVMSLSTAMYPTDAPNPIREEFIHDGPPHESNYSYSFAKRLVEPSIRAYRTEFGMNVIGLVPNGMFGENGIFDGERAVMVAALIRRFVENRDTDAPIVIWGDGSPLREYTYAPDMARAYMWCLDNYDDARILHPGSCEEHSVRETAFMIANIVGVDSARIVFDTSKPSGIHRKSTDNSRFLSMSGMRYTPFRDGLEATIRWYMANLASAAREPALALAS